MEPWTPKWKKETLRQLRLEWNHCSQCPLSETRNKVVFGTGNPDADIMFVGEAPGEMEDGVGEPFVGRSGEIFRAMWEGTGQSWDDIYVTNLVCCRPPDNRNPTSQEKDPCFERLQEQIYIVDPLLVIAVGREPLQYLVGRNMGIEDKHGKLLSPGVNVSGHVFPRTNDDRKVWHLNYDVVAIYHPAYILRKDSYDPKTDTFTPNGIAAQTYEDLERIILRIELIKEAFDKVNPMIERSRNA